MNKYHNIKTKVDGIVFDSIKEANRYSELKLMEKAGEIRKLVIKPKFELQRAFEEEHWGKIKLIYYIADFQYEDKKFKWETVVEDVKGKKTTVYELKKKMFLFRYPYLFIET